MPSRVTKLSGKVLLSICTITIRGQHTPRNPPQLPSGFLGGAVSIKPEAA